MWLIEVDSVVLKYGSDSGKYVENVLRRIEVVREAGVMVVISSILVVILVLRPALSSCPSLDFHRFSQ